MYVRYFRGRGSTYWVGMTSQNLRSFGTSLEIDSPEINVLIFRDDRSHCLPMKANTLPKHFLSTVVRIRYMLVARCVTKYLPIGFG